MKMVSMVALAAAMLAVASPAAAQKKGKDEGPKLELSTEFRKPAGAADAAIKAKDWATADTQLNAAEAIAKNDDERYFIASMRLTVEANKNNLEGVVKALDALLASTKTPPSNLGTYNFFRGDTAFKLNRRAEAVPYLLKARELGYQTDQAQLSLMIAQAYFDGGKTAEGIAEINKAIEAEKAAGKKPPQQWYEFVINKVYKGGDRAATADWLMRTVHEYPTITNWRRVIVLYRDSSNPQKVTLDKKQKLDLFRLMAGTGALADENDYVDYAYNALSTGLPWEAITVIDAGRKAGKIPAGSASDVGSIYSNAQNGVKAEGSLDGLAKSAATAANGKSAAATGDAYLASGDYAKALELYDLALQKGTVDANEVNLHRGVALFRLNRKPEAKQAFTTVQSPVLKDIAGFWVSWIDMPNPPTA